MTSRAGGGETMIPPDFAEDPDSAEDSDSAEDPGDDDGQIR